MCILFQEIKFDWLIVFLHIETLTLILIQDGKMYLEVSKDIFFNRI